MRYQRDADIAGVRLKMNLIKSSMKVSKVLVAFAFAAACSAPDSEQTAPAPAPGLPAPHANNAVAVAPEENGALFYSFNGLEAGKTHEDVSKRAFKCVMPEGGCEEIAGAPVEAGRLASVAVFLYDRIFLFGGYTVAEDGSEKSTPEVFAFNPETDEFQRRADMPVPVDDMVAFHYGNRYIYLISGWHDEGNVSLVQVFDTWEDTWFRATDYPGAPVFGHAGGNVDDKFVIADGVAVVGHDENGRRQFGAVNEVWRGDIDKDNPAIISWSQLPPHPGGPLYRMGASGDAENNRVVFFGGADNPYNYNGIGYDGEPANASDLVFAYDFDEDAWVELGRADKAVMDLRGLMAWDGAWWTLGGMDDDRKVIGDLMRIDIEK